jgi:putative OPT family oligopeptide transporter
VAHSNEAQTITTPVPETPVDFVTPQLTLKSALTGMILGGVLSICNIYTGLKIGWGLNMSITGILLAFSFWFAISKISFGRVKNINKLENNVNQSAVSAAGAVSSAGLVSAIPALTMIEGTVFPWWQLFLWISTVCFVGIAVAMGLRRQMVIRDKLPFPGGLACAETLKEVYNTGSEALKRVGLLGLGAFVGGFVKFCEIKKWVAKTDFGMQINGAPASAYGLALDPALVMVAVGGLVGFRACWSIILGTILAFVVIGTELVDRKIVAGPSTVKDWVLWPGVTLMVISSLVSFGFSLPSIVRSFSKPKASSADTAPATADTGEVSRRWFLASLTISLILCVILQTWFFGIAWWAAVIAVILSFVLAIVACRVSGETNVTPVGAMGKVTQLVFAGLMPASPAANLMSASVTAGAASQCADLMHDLKCGYLLGNIARKQVFGQILGSIAGAAVASYFYLVLIPDPKGMLGGTEWPAPAVKAWKAVADLFSKGFDSLPQGTPLAIAIAAGLGIVVPILEKVFPKAKPYIPSPAAFGLAFVITPSNGISMFIGGCIALVLSKAFTKWSDKYLVTICAGIIAGESLVGAGDALRLVWTGMSTAPAAQP